MTEAVWYVVMSKPQREATAFSNIVAQDFTAFLPLGKEPGKPARPLFPSYLFVEIARNQNWWPIMNTRGVNKILSTPDLIPVPVPCAVIDELRSRLVDDAIPLRATTGARSFDKGQKVRITAGAFQSLDALFVALRGDRAEIILDIAGRAAKVTVDADMLDIVKSVT